MEYRQLFSRAALAVPIYAELVRMLFASFLPLTTVGLATAGIAAVVAHKTEDSFLAVMAAVALLVTVARITITVWFQRADRLVEDMPAWELRYGLGSFVFSIVLGLVGMRSFAFDDTTVHMLATALLFAYSSGVIMRLCVRPLICVGTLLLAALPIIAASLLRGDVIYFALAGLLVMMVVGGLETAFHIYRSIIGAIGTRQKFEAMAKRDALTGLPNRLMLDDAVVDGLLRSHAAGKVLALHFLDLDKFKAANDRFGHPFGDALLVEVARRLMGAMREGDMVARVGGDEFVVVQQRVSDENDAEALAWRLISTLSMPYSIEGHTVLIGASVGIAMAPRDGTEPQQLLAAADMALYASKGAGRGKALFYEAPRSLRAG